MSDPTPTPTTTTAPAETPVETPSTAPTAPPTVPTGPTGPTSLTITVLVQSGARHNFLLDTAYLDRHAVKAVTEPLDMTVTQLKECIWKDWRDDWDQRPASAQFIKLIQFGAYLQDSSMLKDCRLSLDGANVIHMAIRPAESGADDETQRSTKAGRQSSRERNAEGGSSTGCRCVIL
ncbi:hypothetical protein FPQ18DRAFT_89210 [Pyronema domesticum]|uniref:Similar to Membrane-anchored ubiquitin-fold protein 3 acc. no. Q6Z8K4 n=1 Tax=Pyronema omphalodes (strain CBS 100304) TaxID=1076935 RepID=U4KZ95_PYROM|nr:hypothetical protein FPQ18DRAFT_89210 [Pyronema domesticum]CCX07376.1 Similar to Membrane-anchored ubiquitin-fold protein 3; acc. no. Q6Z8K4 [Pyronema omphalodes CBS 100304]